MHRVSLAILLTAAAAQAQWKTPWTYEGAASWGSLDPDYAACGGKQQSPIDIDTRRIDTRRAETANLPPLQFVYKSGPLKYLINNGYAIRVNYHDGPGAGNALIVGGTRYQLTQFHFHHPSEEYVDGKPFDMVLHLMHESGEGKVVGVAVLLKAGKPNAMIQRIWDHMPATKGGEEEIAGVEINPAAFLPQSAGYYTYEGSQTAPPCTEGVTWFILKTPATVSAAQIAAFAKIYPHDVRPIQPLNGRVVKQSR